MSWHLALQQTPTLTEKRCREGNDKHLLGHRRDIPFIAI
jgi:hypothetical protein